jgi:hypothetical protein
MRIMAGHMVGHIGGTAIGIEVTGKTGLVFKG